MGTGADGQCECGWTLWRSEQMVSMRAHAWVMAAMVGGSRCLRTVQAGGNGGSRRQRSASDSCGGDGQHGRWLTCGMQRLSDGSGGTDLEAAYGCGGCGGNGQQGRRPWQQQQNGDGGWCRRRWQRRRMRRRQSAQLTSCPLVRFQESLPGGCVSPARAAEQSCDQPWGYHGQPDAAGAGPLRTATRGVSS